MRGGSTRLVYRNEDTPQERARVRTMQRRAHGWSTFRFPEPRPANASGVACLVALLVVVLVFLLS